MILLGILSILLWGSGVWLSANTPGHPGLHEESRAHGWIVLGFFVFLAPWFMSIRAAFDPLLQQLVATILLGLTGVCWALYFSTVGGHWITVSIPRWWMRDHKIKVIVSYDLGDAAMKAGDPEKASRLYRLELEKHPDDPELFLRLAEAYRKLKDPPQVVANLRSAARVAPDPERKGSVSLLLADELKAAGDRGGSETVLQGILRDPALARFHAGAKARLQRPWG